MRYFQVNEDMDRVDAWMLGDLLDAGGREVLRWQCSEGKRVDWSGTLSVQVTREGIPLDLNFNTFNTMIVSEQAKRLIERWAPDAVQFLPVDVARASQRYFIANIVSLVDCLDEDLSYVERWENGNPVRPDLAGQISLVIDLHIDVKRAEGHHLFRIKGDDISTIVSEELKEALDKAGLSGFKYEDVTRPTKADFVLEWEDEQRQRRLRRN